MYIFPYYCAYCDNKITEIVVRTATVVCLSCNSCCPEYFQCCYCNIEVSCHKKYHRLNQNHILNKITKRHKKISESKGYMTHLVY